MKNSQEGEELSKQSLLSMITSRRDILSSTKVSFQQSSYSTVRKYVLRQLYISGLRLLKNDSLDLRAMKKMRLKVMTSTKNCQLSHCLRLITKQKQNRSVLNLKESSHSQLMLSRDTEDRKKLNAWTLQNTNKCLTQEWSKLML